MAGNMILTGNIKSLLRDGLHAVFSDSKTYKDEWRKVFSDYSSHRNFEEETEMELLGAAARKPEGQSGLQGSMQELIKSSYQMFAISNSFAISNEAMSDNLYKDQFPKGALALKDSIAEAENIEGFNILNNGFNANYTGGDGQPLFSQYHPTGVGVYSNTFSTGASLSQSSLQNAITQVKQFRSASGNRDPEMVKRLIVPTELMWTAKKLLRSHDAPDTANRAINTVYGAVPEGYHDSVYLTNPNAWFLTTQNSNGLKHFTREGLRIDSWPDIAADSLMIRGIKRIAFGWSNARGAFGSIGI